MSACAVGRLHIEQSMHVSLHQHHPSQHQLRIICFDSYCLGAIHHIQRKGICLRWRSAVEACECSIEDATRSSCEASGDGEVC